MQTKFCQAKSAVLAEFFAYEHHIFYGAAAAAAIGSINIPIRAANVVGAEIAEARATRSIACGVAFEFEESADGCFIEVQMKAVKAETGPVFFIAEAGTETRCGREVAGQSRACGLRLLPFRAVLCSGRLCRRAELGRGSLGGEDRATAAPCGMRAVRGAGVSMRSEAAGHSGGDRSRECRRECSVQGRGRVTAPRALQARSSAGRSVTGSLTSISA